MIANVKTFLYEMFYYWTIYYTFFTTVLMESYDILIFHNLN